MKEKIINRTLEILLWLALAFTIISPITPVPIQATNPMRVVGFINGDPYGTYLTIEYAKLTHLIYENVMVTSNTNAVLYDTQGDFSFLTNVTTRAKAAKPSIIVLASLAGGNWNSTDGGNLTAIMANSTNRTQLVSNLVNLVSDYSLDGINIDWEGSDINNGNYHLFLEALDAALPAGKIISVCGPAGLEYQPATDYQYWFNPVADDPYIDMYELMLYGIAYPNEATYADFVTYTNMWIADGFSAAKLNLGIPLAGCDSTAEITSYKYVISDFNPAVTANTLNITEIRNTWGSNETVHGGILGYTGYNLAINKTTYAIAHAVGGMMLWAVDYDAVGNAKSLLSAVYETVVIPAPPLTSPSENTMFAYLNTINGTSLTGEIMDYVNMTADASLYGENMSPSFIGANYMNTMLDAGNFPRSLFWFPFAFMISIIIGFIVFKFSKSLLLQAVTSALILGMFCGAGLLPWWTVLIFGVEVPAIIIASKQTGF